MIVSSSLLAVLVVAVQPLPAADSPAPEDVFEHRILPIFRSADTTERQTTDFDAALAHSRLAARARVTSTWEPGFLKATLVQAPALELLAGEAAGPRSRAF